MLKYIYFFILRNHRENCWHTKAMNIPSVWYPHILIESLVEGLLNCLNAYVFMVLDRPANLNNLNLRGNLRVVFSVSMGWWRILPYDVLPEERRRKDANNGSKNK